jgi:hypothetical protein
MKNSTTESLIESIRKVCQALLTALIILALFLVLLVLSAILVMVRLLPYLLRVVSILAWAVSLFFVFVSVSNLCGKFSDAVAAMLTASLITLIIALAPMAFNKLGGDAIFGGYLFAALVGLGVKILCESLTPTYYPTASILPPTLAAMCLILVVTTRRQ